MTPLPLWQRFVAVMFMLCFAAATLFLLHRYVMVVWSMFQMSSWVEVPVTVTHWNESSHSTASSRPNTILHQVTGQYQYRWDGTSYTSTRVALGQSADNFSKRHRQNMREALEDETPSAWVNPDNPTQSVMVRNFPWEKMLFDVTFLLFPCGIISFVVCAYLALAIKRWWFPPSLPLRLWGAWHGLLLLPVIWWGWSLFSFGAWLVVLVHCVIVGSALLMPVLKSPPSV